MAWFFGQNFKICIVPFLLKDNDEIKKNLELYRISCILLLIIGAHIYLYICPVPAVVRKGTAQFLWQHRQESVGEGLEMPDTFSWFLGEDWATWHIWHIFFEVSQGGTSRSVGKALKCQMRFRDFLVSAGQLGISGTFFFAVSQGSTHRCLSIF